MTRSVGNSPSSRDMSAGKSPKRSKSPANAHKAAGAGSGKGRETHATAPLPATGGLEPMEPGMHAPAPLRAPDYGTLIESVPSPLDMRGREELMKSILGIVPLGMSGTEEVLMEGLEREDNREVYSRLYSGRVSLAYEAELPSYIDNTYGFRDTHYDIRREVSWVESAFEWVLVPQEHKDFFRDELRSIRTTAQRGFDTRYELTFRNGEVAVVDAAGEPYPVQKYGVPETIPLANRVPLRRSGSDSLEFPPFPNLKSKSINGVRKWLGDLEDGAAQDLLQAAPAPESEASFGSRPSVPSRPASRGGPPAPGTPAPG